MSVIGASTVTSTEFARRAIQALSHEAEGFVKAANDATAAVVARDGKPAWNGLLREAPRVLLRQSHDPAPVRQELMNAKNALNDAHRTIEAMLFGAKDLRQSPGRGGIDDALRGAIDDLGPRLEDVSVATITSTNATRQLEVAGEIDVIALDVQRMVDQVAKQLGVRSAAVS